MPRSAEIALAPRPSVRSVRRVRAEHVEHRGGVLARLIPRVGAQVGHPQHQSEGERRHRGAEEECRP
ncbi:MAG TPA: hypothetical protein P5314_06595, partial [Tetrasphaera sp.]|nr:hypothetical protein [Tetrasphaera sp.]